MAAIAATDVTVTVETRERVVKHRRNRVKIAFGDGVLTYPSGGVPLPAFGVFGMKRNLDYLILSDSNDASGFIWKYDQDNRKLRAYRQGGTTGATAAGAAGTGAKLVGENAVEGVVQIPGTVASTTYDFGPLKECTTAFLPAAQVIYAEAVGF